MHVSVFELHTLDILVVIFVGGRLLEFNVYIQSIRGTFMKNGLQLLTAIT